MDFSDTRDSQYLSLRTAAALAYIRLVGRAPDVREAVAMQRVLNDIAQAIAVIAPIRTYDGTTAGEPPRALQPLDLIEGRFERGASALRVQDGHDIRQLVIQRRDLEAAIATLEKTDLAKALAAKRP